jgi:hypothetical protein
LRSFLGDCGIKSFCLQKTKPQHRRFLSRDGGLAILIWHNDRFAHCGVWVARIKTAAGKSGSTATRWA